MNTHVFYPLNTFLGVEESLTEWGGLWIPGDLSGPLCWQGQKQWLAVL